MRLLDQIDECKQLWAVLIPWCASPPDNILANWLLTGFTEDELAYAMRRAAAKFGAGTTPDQVGRYTTGILRTQRQRKLKEQRGDNAKVNQ
ncbi:MAG: hypothetical protein ACLP6G_19065 [Terriglobales bacterium]